MATPRVTIPELPIHTAPEDGDLMVVQNGSVTKKMTIASFNTQASADINAHIVNPTDAHDASAVSTTPNTAPMTGTNVQLQLSQAGAEIAAVKAVANTVTTGLTDHLADTIDVHDASAISFVPTGTVSANEVQSAITELEADISGTVANISAIGVSLNTHITDLTDAHDASAISVTPISGLSGNNVQTVLVEIAGGGGGPGGGTVVGAPTDAASNLVANQPQPSFVTRDPANPIWTAASSVFGSVYWPYVVKVGHLPISPFDEWYMYISTDHNYGQGGVPDGGVELVSAPTLDGPWTSQGLIYADPGAGDSIETASVIFNEQTNLFHMFHQRYDAHTDGGQATCLTTSVNGYSGWSPFQVILDSPAGWRPGGQPNAPHTGYFRPFRFGNWWAGYSLSSAGISSRFMISYSVDGVKWMSDSRGLGKGSESGSPGWVNTTPFRWQGETWAAWAVPTVLFPTQIMMGKLSNDFRHALGPPIPVLNVTGTEVNPNGAPIRSLQAIVDGSTVHFFYKAGGTIDYDGAIYHAWINPQDLP